MLDPGHAPVETQHDDAGVNELARGHTSVDTQLSSVPRNDLPPTRFAATPIARTSAATISDPDQRRFDAQGVDVEADLDYGWLTLLAGQVDEFMALRLASESRLRSLIHLTGGEQLPQAVAQRALVKALKSNETSARTALAKAMRDHPLGGFVNGRTGIGEVSIGRLLGLVGNPADRPNVAKFWQYCGHGDPARSKRRSEAVIRHTGGRTTLPFSPRAKTIVWQIAESAYRRGLYRVVYLDARAACAEKTHSVTCRNTVRPPGKPNGCGTSAHPEWGEPGSPWRPGHQHAHALRVVGKAILLDLWLYAKEQSA